MMWWRWTRPGQPQRKDLIMRIDCYHCGERIKIVNADEGDWIECPHCEASAPVPAASMRRQPIYLPVAVPAGDYSDLDEERKIDLREMRRYRNEDRSGNPTGIAGFALCVTTCLFLLGGMVLCKQLPVYLWMVAILAVPATLLGLVFSIVGSLLVGRPKLFSYIGAGIGAFLILAAIPISFLLLKGV